MFVYKIINLINGKLYVGQTTASLKERMKSHRSGARRLSTSKSALYSAMLKYGINNFKIDLIAIASSKEELDISEIFWIANLNTLCPTGYNLKSGGSYGKHSEHTKLRQSLIKKEWFSKNVHPMLGKTHSQETKKKLSDAKLGKPMGPFSEEHKRKIGDAHRGMKKPHSEARKEHQRKLMTGRKNSEETKLKRAAKMKKKVKCIEDGMIFSSIKEAANFHGIISSCLGVHVRGKTQYVESKTLNKKLHFCRWSE